MGCYVRTVTMVGGTAWREIIRARCVAVTQSRALNVSRCVQRCGYKTADAEEAGAGSSGLEAIKVRDMARTFDVHKPLAVPTVFTPPSLATIWQVGPHKPLPETWVRDFVTDSRKSIAALPRMLFDASPRLDLIHRLVAWQQAALRAGTAKTKSRAEVKGSTRKIYPQ